MNATAPSIEVRLRPEQWDVLIGMFVRAQSVSDKHKSLADQNRDKAQAAKIRERLAACRSGGCAMTATWDQWSSLLRQGERLAKFSGEWRALADITGIVSKGMNDADSDSR